MNKRYIFLVGPVAMLMLASCKQPKKQNTALPPTPVVVATAGKMKAVYYDQYPGTVTALNSVELRSQVAGFVTGIYFKEGSVVQKGTTLYEIDRRKYEAAYMQAKANLSSAQANLVRSQKDADRYTELLRKDAVAKQLVDNAVATLASSKAQVESAKAGVTSAKTDLDYSLIKAPFTGRIGLSQVKLGAQVTPGTTLLNTISSEDPIAVDFVVDEAAIPRFTKMEHKNLNTDSTFRVALSDGSVLHQPGKLVVIDRGVDNQSGTIKVRIQFPNPSNQLISGMSCVLKVLNQDSGIQLTIPYKAITEQMGEFFVFVAQADTIAKQHKVKVGPRVSDKIVIMSGLEEGDKVITEGIGRLRDGGKIQVGPAKPAAQGQGTQQAPK